VPLQVAAVSSHAVITMLRPVARSARNWALQMPGMSMSSGMAVFRNSSMAASRLAGLPSGPDHPHASPRRRAAAAHEHGHLVVLDRDRAPHQLGHLLAGDLHGLLAGGHRVGRVPVRGDDAQAKLSIGQEGQAPVAGLGLNVRAYGSFEVAGPFIQPRRVAGQHVHSGVHDLLLVRFSAVRHSRPAAIQPRLRDRERSLAALAGVTEARCGRPQRSCALPGQQLRHVFGTAANVNPHVHDMADHHLSSRPWASGEASCAQFVQSNTIPPGGQGLDHAARQQTSAGTHNAHVCTGLVLISTTPIAAQIGGYFAGPWC